MAKHTNTFFQYSTITALIGKSLDGSITVKQLLTKGNYGIGTFDSLDGELIILDGAAYQMLGGGQINAAVNNLTSPFATVFNFKVSRKWELHELNYQQLETSLLKAFKSLNQFYAYRITGSFTTMMTRVVKKQAKPYPALTEASQTQEITTLNDVKGTIIGFWTPEFAKTIGVKGFHSHFITDDYQSGGHVFNFMAQTLTVEICAFNQMELLLPATSSYLQYQINEEKLQADIATAESKR